MDDVLIVGAGPAGSVAATVLARAGVRVRLIDRAAFPRDKLCGDTINPGTLALLGRLRLADPIEPRALRVDGMLVTGEGGVAIRGVYPEGRWGLAITRRDLDLLLVQQAVAAGARFECGTRVRGAIVAEAGPASVVEGVTVGANGSTRQLRARCVIAADGRRSTLGFALHLSRHPNRPKRWAIGAYFEAAAPAPSLGEMHIRRGRYIGVAPVPGGLTNVCVVKPWSGPPPLRFGVAGGSCEFQDPAELFRREIAADPMLRDRFGGRGPVDRPVMLGPLAVDVANEAYDGLIFAGDAAGFIDPMTGDGLRFAIRGGELAALAALDSLQHGWNGVHARLRAARAREFASKWRFNRALRALVASSPAVRAATTAARFSPAVMRALIARAGDCDIT